jgi:hypothetical protein
VTPDLSSNELWKKPLVDWFFFAKEVLDEISVGSGRKQELYFLD